MAAKPPVKIWVGTRKGAFLFHSTDRRNWTTEGPFFPGEEVHHVAQDRRDRRVFAAVNNAWFGPHLYSTTNGGRKWNLSDKGLEVQGIEGATLKRIWHIAPGHEDEPGVIYLGADPGVLFRSGDRGASWDMVRGLSQHPTREKWTPGAGGMMVHSIQPLGAGQVVVGISAAGAFRSSDRGETWEPFNAGVRADFLPEKFPAVGQCVHKLKAHPVDKKSLYQQNHCGIYRSAIGSAGWDDISRGLPTRFGFALAVPAAEKQTLFTVPIDSAEHRFVPGGRLRVARSRNGGRSWKLLTRGLPQKGAYVLVLREAMTSDDRDPAGVYFGTSTGTIFYSRDAGERWQTLAEQLPPVYSLSFGAA